MSEAQFLEEGLCGPQTMAPVRFAYPKIWLSGRRGTWGRVRALLFIYLFICLFVVVCLFVRMFEITPGSLSFAFDRCFSEFMLILFATGRIGLRPYFRRLFLFRSELNIENVFLRNLRSFYMFSNFLSMNNLIAIQV